MRDRFGEILVSAAGQADEIKLAGCARERPGDRVRGLERRDDPFQPRGAHECFERLNVGDGDVARPTRVAQPRVLRTAAGIIEPGRDRVRLEDLTFTPGSPAAVSGAP